MATAQTKLTLKCDLCHCDRDIKWKCEDCNEWLCYNCKTIHRNSKGHNVVSPNNKPDQTVLYKRLDCEVDDERTPECVTNLVMLQPPTVPPYKNINVISRFHYQYSASEIACWNNNEAWIAGDKKLALVRHDGEIIKFIDCPYIVFGLVKTNKGKLLISAGSEGIKTLNDEENSIIDLCSTLPPFTGGICITADEDIYTCGCQEYTKVIKLSITGKIKQTINFEVRKYAVKEAYFIAQNINGDLWITSMSSKCVVVLKINGEFRFQYMGPTDMEEDFGPREIICNKNGQALITDIFNDKIHLVDRDGYFLQFILTKEHGLKGPLLISQDKNGRIWVGCTDRKTIIVAEYLK